MFLIPVLSQATARKINGIYYNLDSSTKKAEVTNSGGGGSDSNYRNSYSSSTITIPETVTYDNQTYDVTSIGAYAFTDCQSLRTVNIPNSVTSIGRYAFAWCIYMTSADIPNNVTSIGEWAFNGCNSLTSINIPNGITHIESNAFARCCNVPSVTIPNGVTTIGNHAFQECTAFTSITIPEGVTTIGQYAFEHCDNLASVSIPNSVTYIGFYAFADCGKLTSISIPTGVTDIKNYTFQYCDNLSSVFIPSSVKTIGVYAFADCTNLASVTIPSSVTSIDDYAFKCDNLITVISERETPATISETAFTNHANATLYVPSGNIVNYSSTDNWKDFKSIVAIGTKKDINNSDISVSIVASSLTYNGSAQEPEILVKDGITTLENGIDYVVSYSNTTIGMGSMTIEGIGNYTGTRNQNFYISPRNVYGLTITIPAVTYDGTAQVPTVTVKHGNATLINGTDYTVAYSNNINAGTATVTITGKGNYYTGTTTSNFTINKAPLTITAKSYTIMVDDPLPAFEAEYSGFVNSENSSILTTQPTLSCTATSTSSPGTYDIDVSGADAQNYSMTYVKGILTISLPSVSYTMNSYGVGTYCSEYDLDFTDVSGIRAYVACGFNPTTGVVFIMRVTEVPANTGIMIKGTPGTYSIPVKDTDMYYENMFKGTLTPITVPATEDGYKNYVLGSDKLFHGSLGGSTLIANRAYLQIPLSAVGGNSNAPEFVTFEEDNVTGIVATENIRQMMSDGETYNLNGQRVASPKKGLYIRNGKKVLIY